MTTITHDHAAQARAALSAFIAQTQENGGGGMNGWYVYRWWVDESPRVVYDRDVPLLGGTLGGAYDLFGPFDNEGDAHECGVIMGQGRRVEPVPHYTQLTLWEAA